MTLNDPYQRGFAVGTLVGAGGFLLLQSTETAWPQNLLLLLAMLVPFSVAALIHLTRSAKSQVSMSSDDLDDDESYQ